MKPIVFLLLMITSASVYARDRMICSAVGGTNIVDMNKGGSYGFSCYGKSSQFPEDGKKYKGIDAIMDDGWLPLSVGSGLGDGGPGSGGVLFIIFEK